MVARAAAVPVRVDVAEHLEVERSAIMRPLSCERARERERERESGEGGLGCGSTVRSRRSSWWVVTRSGLQPSALALCGSAAEGRVQRQRTPGAVVGAPFAELKQLEPEADERASFLKLCLFSSD